MKSFLKKITATTFITLMLTISLAPVTLAQQTSVSDPLGSIKKEIDVVDYSQETIWGGLSSELITVLVEDGSTSLNDLAGKDLESIMDILRESDRFEDSEESEVSAAANTILFSIRITLWGNLTEDVIEIMIDNGHDSLSAFALAAGYGGPSEEPDLQLDSNRVLAVLLDMDELTEDQKNLIFNEIIRSGTSQINAIVLAVTKVIRNLLGGLAVIWIIISGIQLIMSGSDESKVTEQKRSITYALVGLGIVLLMERLVVLVYGIPGVEIGLSTQGPGVSSEIIGVVNFMKALIGSIAIFMIIISGFQTIAAAGDEEKITKQRKSIMWVIVGIIIILINQVVVENFFIDPAASGDQISKSNVQNIIELIGTVTQFILGFVGLIAFAALIYGAGTMITNYGNDEAVEKAKKIIKNALIGIIVIISAFTIISTVIL